MNQNFKKQYQIECFYFSYAFLPFGQGPRGCIGMRFALLEAKLALASIIRKYNLSPSSKTQEPLELDPTTAIAYVKHGLYIKAEQRIWKYVIVVVSSVQEWVGVSRVSRNLTTHSESTRSRFLSGVDSF